MPEEVTRKSDKAVESEIEHDKHGPEYYERNTDELPDNEDHGSAERSARGNGHDGEHSPPMRHGSD